MTWGKKPRNKYGNKKVEEGGRQWGSQGEKSLMTYLFLLEKAGEIKDIKQQDHVKLTRAEILYIADYRVYNIINEQFEWYEFKGFPTSDWKIKRRLWTCYGPGLLHIFGGNWKNIKHMETIIPDIEI